MAWQTGRVRVVLNREGIREILKSAEVGAVLMERAELTKSAADVRYEQIPVGARHKKEETPGASGAAATPDAQAAPDAPAEKVTIETRVETGNTTTRTYVRVVADHPAAQYVEAKHRVLGQSIDAAKD